MVTPSRLTLTALLLPVLLAGCSDEGSSGSSEPDRPRATEEAVDYPDEGVDLAGEPALEGVYADGLQAYVDFERGRRLAAREGKVSRLLALSATARVVDPYREAFAAFGDGGEYGGDVVIEFLDAQPRGRLLQLDLCVDATALVVPDGAPTILGEATRAPERIDVTMIEGLWRVTQAEPLDGSC